MKKSNSYNSISAVAALLLLGVFSIGILGVLLSGARIYKNLSESGRLQYDRRTCSQYLSAFVARSPTPESLQIEEFDGCQALVIREDGCALRTYCYNGYLMELYSLDIAGFSAADGEKLLPLDSLQILQTGDLLTFQVTCNGESWALHHSIRGYGYEK